MINDLGGDSPRRMALSSIYFAIVWHTWYTTFGPLARCLLISTLEYKAKEGELLFHYCSPATLHAILEGKKLRFSDVLSMNDSMEFKWGAQLLKRAMGANAADDAEAFAKAKGIADWFVTAQGILEEHGLLTACCLSKRGDVLSQWRAYADNGAGFAVGFDSAAMARMPVRPLDVCYEPEKQRWHLGEAISKIIASPDAVVDGKSLMKALLIMLLDTVGFKNPAFEEEDEVRLVHHISLTRGDGVLVPTYEDSVTPPDVRFYMRGSVPTAFVDLELPGGHSAVKKIFVGPRANVEVRSLQIMLGSMGFQNIEIEKSSATYR